MILGPRIYPGLPLGLYLTPYYASEMGISLVDLEISNH